MTIALPKAEYINQFKEKIMAANSKLSRIKHTSTSPKLQINTLKGRS